VHEREREEEEEKEEEDVRIEKYYMKKKLLTCILKKRNAKGC
jgi:hypothetical protein